MYQKSSKHLDDVFLHLRHEYDDIVEGNLHIQVEGGDNYAEVYVPDAERVSNFIGRIRAIRRLSNSNIQPFHYQNMNSESTNLSI